MFPGVETALCVSDLSPFTLGRAVPDSARPWPLGEHHGPQHRLRPAHGGL